MARGGTRLGRCEGRVLGCWGGLDSTETVKEGRRYDTCSTTSCKSAQLTADTMLRRAGRGMGNHIRVDGCAGTPADRDFT